MHLLLEVKEIVKNYGLRRVLKGVSFQLYEGEIFVLAGPNGAGKTTLLKIIAGLSKPVSGEIIWKELSANRARLSYLGHSSGLYHDLSPQDNLKFLGDTVKRSERQSSIDAALQEVGLYNRKYDPVRNFSRGMIQRCALARIILQDARVVLLDEPFTGLDLEGQQLMERLLLEWKKQRKGIIAVFHDPSKIVQFASQILILSNGEGRLLESSSIPDAEELKKILASGKVEG